MKLYHWLEKYGSCFDLNGAWSPLRGFCRHCAGEVIEDSELEETRVCNVCGRCWRHCRRGSLGDEEH